MLGGVARSRRPRRRRRQGPTGPDLPRPEETGGPQPLPGRTWSSALDEGNLMVTPGTAYFGDNQVALDTNVMVSDVEELNDLPIRIGPDADATCATSARPRTPAPSRSRACASTASSRYTSRSTARPGPAAWPSPTASRKSCRRLRRRAARGDEARFRHGPVGVTSARPSTA